MKINLLTNKLKASYLSLIAILFSGSAYADYDIGAPDDGPLAAFSGFVQELVNFVDGPVALAFSFFSIAGFGIFWAVAPKAVGAMGFMLRAIIAVIIILNVGVWITALNS